MLLLLEKIEFLFYWILDFPIKIFILFQKPAAFDNIFFCARYWTNKSNTFWKYYKESEHARLLVEGVESFSLINIGFYKGRTFWKNCSPIVFSIAHGCPLLKIVWLGNCPLLKNSWLRHCQHRLLKRKEVKDPYRHHPLVSAILFIHNHFICF